MSMPFGCRPGRPGQISFDKAISYFLLFIIVFISDIRAQKYESSIYTEKRKNGEVTFLNLLKDSKVFYSLPIISNIHYLSYFYHQDFLFKIEGFPQPEIGISYIITKSKINKNKIDLIDVENVYFKVLGNKQPFYLKTHDSSINLIRRTNNTDEILYEWGTEILMNDSLGLKKVAKDIDVIKKTTENNYYCAKIDSLFCQRFFWKSSFVNEPALIGALERKSKIYSSCEEKGFAGYVYFSDSIFMADIEKWRSFFNCTNVRACSNRIFRP